ncbi:MAG: DNA recombination protein RmuC [Candidatus Izimaplasma sp.]|nr:DNA recombination protein RmuC [Candidatus Izimaplasma bacterium]
MEYILLGLLVVTILLLATIIALVIKNKDADLSTTIKDQNNELFNKITRENGEIKVELANSIGKSSKENIKDLNTFKEGLTEDISKRFNHLNEQIENKMDNINKKVEFRLNEGFEKTNKTFTSIVERLSKIDEAQKNIDKLSTEVVSLQNILTDKKTRGTFGEVQLNHILESIFGEKNMKVFDTQVTLSNGKKVDALIHLPELMGDLAIDSKFPLENYQRMVDKDVSKQDKELASRVFKKDVKKHIDDIASKYIIPTETSEQAILFVPAEAIFAEINAYHQDIVDYAQRKRIWIASPTTLMSLLTTVQMMLRNAERDKHAKVIQEELIKLSDEFTRYQERWDKLSRTIDTVNKDVKNIHITSNKIGKKFSEISNVNIETKEQIDDNND